MDDIEPVNVVYCYSFTSSEDQRLRDELDKHISIISNVKTENYNAIIGVEMEVSVNTTLATADILLLLESVDFQGSDDYPNMLSAARKMYNDRKIYVVPIILRPATIGDKYPYPVLPRNREPITLWPNRDEAFLDVAVGVRSVVNIINANRKRKSYLEKADRDFANSRYEEALDKYRTALTFFPLDPFADSLSINKCKAKIWCKIADIQSLNERWLEALEAYQHVIDHDPSDVTYVAMAKIYAQSLSDPMQAIEMYTMAIRLKRDNPDYYIQNSILWLQVGEDERALLLYEKAIEACAEKSKLRRYKGKILYECKRYAEACEFYKAALVDDPNNAYLHSEYGDALFAAKRLREALEVYEKAIDVYHDENINNETYFKTLEQKRNRTRDERDLEIKKTQDAKSRIQPLK